MGSSEQRQAELHEALAHFIGHFEWVFDTDWDHTKGCLRNPDSFIDVEFGTFITPAEVNESNNWSSREGLLESYRHLVEVMLKLGIEPREPNP
jgi:hypothetical protein